MPDQAVRPIRPIISLILPALLLLGLELLGIWRENLSHPFWSLSSVIQGVLAGGLLAIVWLRFQAKPLRVSTTQLTILTVLLLAAGTVTLWGKSGFAASFAEDKFAGRMWFLGFKATMFMAYLWLFAFGLRMGRSADQDSQV